MMTMMATMKKLKSAIIACAGVALAIVVVVMCGLLVTCSSQADGGSVDSTEGIIAVLDETDSLAEGIEVAEAAQESEVAANESAIDGQADDPGMETQSAQSSGGSALADSNSPSPATSTETKSQAPTPSSHGTEQKRWVEETQQVWIVDRAAWSESVPVYGTKEVSICNVCGADITGNTSAHGKAHMLAGEGSGHHSEVHQVVTGYNSVSHPAEGHYATRVVGGHWE